jgi:hypothetical protein
MRNRPPADSFRRSDREKRGHSSSFCPCQISLSCSRQPACTFGAFFGTPKNRLLQRYAYAICLSHDRLKASGRGRSQAALRAGSMSLPGASNREDGLAPHTQLPPSAAAGTHMRDCRKRIYLYTIIGDSQPSRSTVLSAEQSFLGGRARTPMSAPRRANALYSWDGPLREGELGSRLDQHQKAMTAASARAEA